MKVYIYSLFLNRLNEVKRGSFIFKFRFSKECFLEKEKK